MSIHILQAFHLEKVRHDFKFITPRPDAIRTSLAIAITVK